MSETRRYSDDEIAEILERATTEPGGRPVVPTETGLTLSELEQIGSEVGIQPERIAAAARSLDLADRMQPARTLLGAPRSVARTLQIDRALSDDEWGQLVADLRRTFDAKGKAESHGPRRSWTNSNLQVHVEPDGDGYAVRMRTLKGNAMQFTLMGVAFAGVGLALGIGTLLGIANDSIFDAAFATAMGAGLIGWARATLPGWARERAEQMEGLAQRIPLLLSRGD